MQFYGPRASLLYFCFFAVFPETNSSHPDRRRRPRQYVTCICMILMAAIFSPRAAQAQGLLSQGTLSFSPSPGSFGSVTAAGTLATTPASVSFGTVVNGTTNSQTVQLKNTGTASTTISSATVSGTGFKLSGFSLPLTLSAGQTSNFTVGFNPAVSGSVTGSVTIKSNATNPTYIMALSGTGAAATRTISLGTSSLNFGNEIVGGSSTLQVAVKNTGNSSLTISLINISATGFSVTSGIIGTTIAAGQTAELNVVFAPKVTGSVSGTVSLVSNATNSPNSIAVAGTGVSSTAHSVAL